jgi:hypothetical protein
LQTPGFSKLIVPFVPMIFLLGLWLFQPWGWWGSLLFFFLVLFLFGIGLWRIHTLMIGSFSQGFKNWLSRQRHDWMNQLQVMMGYVALQKTDQLKQYLTRLSQRMIHERNLTELRYTPFLLFLLTLSVRYPKWEWELDVPEKLQFTKEQRERQAYRLLCQFFDWLAKMGTGENEGRFSKISLGITQNNSYVTFCIELLEGDDSLQSVDIPPDQWQKIERIGSRFHAEMIQLEEASGFLITTLR